MTSLLKVDPEDLREETILRGALRVEVLVDHQAAKEVTLEAMDLVIQEVVVTPLLLRLTPAHGS